MNLNRTPLRVNVGFLLNQPIGTSRVIHIESDNIHFIDLDLLQFHGEARFGRTAQGIFLQADFEAGCNAECVRCLTAFVQPLHASFSELFAFQFKGVSESGLIFPEDGNIDLSPLVREYMLLEIPIRPLCKEDCKGLCLICGADLNQESCEHHPDRGTHQP